MSANSNHISGTDKHARLTRSAPDGGTPVRSCRMPAGGWLREVATNENWRTTTVVQRHRDRAASPAPIK